MAIPQLHFIPEKHWMNDPNGFIYYQGRYHLFYQYFPYENAWGTMHWGHKVSDDLINWENLGVALYPSKPFDKNGVFSGSAIEVDQQMYLYYTGVVYDQIVGDDIHRQAPDAFHACQVLLISPDGYHFDNKKKQVVVPCFKESTPLGHPVHTRDPKIWRENDTYFLMLGCQYSKENAAKTTGEVLIYQSKDAIHFDLASVLEDDNIGTMWECPDYFKVDGQGFLTISAMDYFKASDTQPRYIHQAIYVPVDFDAQTKKMSICGKSQLLDLGEDIYATQTTLDKDGQRTLIGWMRMPNPEADGQWIGMMSLPRVLSYREDGLYMQPHPNVVSKMTQPCGDFHAKQARRLVVDISRGGMIDIGGYQITYQRDGCLCADRSKVFPQETGIACVFKTPPLEACHLEIYTDLHIIEIFINGGKYVLSNIVYDIKNDLRFENISRFEIYQSKS